MSAKSKNKDDELQQSLSSQSIIKTPVKTLSSLLEEGEKYFRDQLYAKSLHNYSEGLNIDPGNVTFLVERAACYLKMGRNDLALEDSENALKQNKNHPKALYEKAEALYAIGEFELALVFFHRGKRLRPDLREFQSGINKAEEAIDNCVGDPNIVKLEISGDLSYFNSTIEISRFIKRFKKLNNKKSATRKILSAKREKRVQSASQKTVRQLLGELYADKVYLEKLLDDDRTTRANTKTGDAIYDLANKGLEFLDTRTEFWRQQKPIYARQISSGIRRQLDNQSLKVILKQLENIDALSSHGNYTDCLTKSQRLLIFLKNYPNNELKDKIQATLESSMGNAYLELGNYYRAIEAHKQDLKISRKIDSSEGITRALENLGRVYARKGEFKKAIEVWEEKLPMVTTDLELTWLNHEIGRCYLELGNNIMAKNYGLKSLEKSDIINDESWKMNALVLIGQSENKLKENSSIEYTIECFNKALELSIKLKDNLAENALRKAIKQVKEKQEELKVNQEKNVNQFENDFEEESRDKTLSSLSSSSSKKSTTSLSSQESTPTEIEYSTIKITTNESYGVEEVFLTLHGTNGLYRKIKLDKSESYEIPFKSGQSDLFKIEDIDTLGDLLKFTLEIEQQELNTYDFKWKIENIELIIKNNKIKHEYQVDENLDKNKKYIELFLY